MIFTPDVTFIVLPIFHAKSHSRENECLLLLHCELEMRGHDIWGEGGGCLNLLELINFCSVWIPTALCF